MRHQRHAKDRFNAQSHDEACPSRLNCHVDRGRTWNLSCPSLMNKSCPPRLKHHGHIQKTSGEAEKALTLTATGGTVLTPNGPTEKPLETHVKIHELQAGVGDKKNLMYECLCLLHATQTLCLSCATHANPNPFSKRR